MKTSVFKCKIDILLAENLQTLFNKQTEEQKLEFVRNALNSAIDKEYPNDPIDIIVEAE